MKNAAFGKGRLLAICLAIFMALMLLPQSVFAESGSALPDGVYRVPVDLWNASSGGPSMGNGALCGSSTSAEAYTSRLIVENGKGTLILKFAPISALGSTGFLYQFTSATSGISNPEVITRYRKTDGSIVYDIYNDPDTGSYTGAYPKLMAVDIGKLPDQLVTPTELSDMIRMSVDVPPMGASSKQHVMLKIGYSDLKEVKDLSGDVEYWLIRAMVFKKQGAMSSDSWQALQDKITEVRTKLENETVSMTIEDGKVHHVSQTLTDAEKGAYSAELATLIEKLNGEVDPERFGKLKEEYVAKLENYADPKDYREAQQTALSAILSEGRAAIEKAETVGDVMAAYSAAGAKIDELQTDAALTKIEQEGFDAYKKEKTASLDQYTATSNLSRYRQAEKLQIQTIASAAKKKINAAETIGDVDAAYSEAVGKIEALETDEAKKLGEARAALQSDIEAASEIEQGSKQKAAFRALKSAIEEAEEQLESESLTGIEEARSQLADAVAAFQASEDRQGIDSANLPDGVYSVQLSMINAANPEQKSMSDDAIVKPALVTAENGEYTLTCYFKGLNIGMFKGYLKELYYWDGSGYQKTAVGEEYALADAFNDENEDGIPDYRYPKKLSFPLIHKDEGDQTDGYVMLRVFVPVMESIAAGTGTQNVFMSIDWSTLKQGADEAEAAARLETAEEPAEEPEPAAKAEQKLKLTDASKAVTYNAKAAASAGSVTVKGNAGKVTYSKVSGNGGISVNSSTGALTVRAGTAAGSYKIVVRAEAEGTDEYLPGSAETTITVTVRKAGQSFKVNTKAKKVKFNKKKAVKTKKIAVTGAAGKVTYTKLSGKKAFTVNKTTGTISVKKGTKRGTYTLKIKVSAAGNGNYKAAAKTVKIKVKVA